MGLDGEADHVSAKKMKTGADEKKLVNSVSVKEEPVQECEENPVIGTLQKQLETAVSQLYALNVMAQDFSTSSQQSTFNDKLNEFIGTLGSIPQTVKENQKSNNRDAEVLNRMIPTAVLERLDDKEGKNNPELYT